MESPELVAVLQERRVAVLTGAGMSTDSGIPDYRGPDSPPSNPMTIGQFTSDPVFRQRYWARNHVGWRHMDETRPNAGHRALAGLDHAGVVTGVITQNVDLLHTKAGSRRVVNLHGTYAQVICLDCGQTMARAVLAELLEAANPGFVERAEAVGGIAVAPDADAIVGDTTRFRIIDCVSCGGMLKPDIVYFGENVPKDRVEQAYSLVDDADALAGCRLVTDGLVGVSLRPARRTRQVSPSRSSTADPPAATTWPPSRSTTAARPCWPCWPTNYPPWRFRRAIRRAAHESAPKSLDGDQVVGVDGGAAHLGGQFGCGAAHHGCQFARIIGDDPARDHRRIGSAQLDDVTAVEPAR